MTFRIIILPLFLTICASCAPHLGSPLILSISADADTLSVPVEHFGLYSDGDLTQTLPASVLVSNTRTVTHFTVRHLSSPVPAALLDADPSNGVLRVSYSADLPQELIPITYPKTSVRVSTEVLSDFIDQRPFLQLDKDQLVILTYSGSRTPSRPTLLGGAAPDFLKSFDEARRMLVTLRSQPSGAIVYLKDVATDFNTDISFIVRPDFIRHLTVYRQDGTGCQLLDTEGDAETGPWTADFQC